MHLRKNVSPNSVPTMYYGVELFFSMNDVTINSKKLRRMFPAKVKRSGDKPYTTEHIRAMLEATRYKRDKAIILFLSSSGARIGSFEKLCLSNIVIYEVEPNPIGADEGKEWVRLFNPSDNPVDMIGWSITSSHGIRTTYFFTSNIEACDFLTIVFPRELIDNEEESLVLRDNDNKVVDVTPNLGNAYSGYTWKNSNIDFDCNQSIRFYENKAYEFSFNAPINWKFQENIGEVQVMIYPQRFNPSLYIDSPHVLVIFENLAESDVPRLNGQEILEYHTNIIKNEHGGKLINSDVKDTPWGWEISTEFFYLEDLGIGSSLQLHTEQKAFHFKDREYYTVAYFATDDYYDTYHPVFEGVINSLVIKGVVVPEFQEIALMVLGGSIVFAIVFTRKLSKLRSDRASSST